MKDAVKGEYRKMILEFSENFEILTHKITIDTGENDIAIEQDFNCRFTADKNPILFNYWFKEF
ncbi:hypothetical protein AKJ59_00645 [candidate division MSBL1 archaeon SCGC-AAA385M02]|uniref:Uncharacterized protein n=1 Tax=candidate division MSBL1 archaeon SCGC-AAA385M02 TaxID=1698287 RepID=A0A133VQI6_9EURY|nr:hypothetical protein AKJ59_00645 [candidate division MSBL1 archaeon SCGC-AAA385M02]